jgi:hypothetical protein
MFQSKQISLRDRAIAYFISVVAVVVALGGAYQLQQSAPTLEYDWQHPAEVERAAQLPTQVTTGCVIRFDTDGPWIHDNSAHECNALDPEDPDAVVVQEDGDVLLTHNAWRGPIISMSVEEDESLVARRIHCGPSGGLTETLVRCYRTDTGSFVRGDSDQLACDLCNWWVQWEHLGVLGVPQ